MAGESDEPTAYLYKGINPMGGGAAAAAKPSSQEKAAMSAQTALLEQEYQRIQDLQGAMQTSAFEAQKMLGLSAKGSAIDAAINQALTYQDPQQYLNRTYTQEEWARERPLAPSSSISDPRQDPKYKYAVSGDMAGYGQAVLNSKKMDSQHEIAAWERYVNEYNQKLKTFNQVGAQGDAYQKERQAWIDKGIYTNELWQEEKPVPPPNSPYEDPDKQYAFRGDKAGWLKAQNLPDTPKYTEAWNNYVEDTRKKILSYDQEFQKYKEQMGIWESKKDLVGKPGSASLIGKQVTPTRKDYEAATIASLTNQILAATQDKGMTEEFEKRLRSALEDIPAESEARNAFLNQVNQLVASPEGVQTFQNLFARVQRGAAGQEPIDPAVSRELARQEAMLGNTLRKQLGSGFATSTAGVMTMGDYASRRAEAIAKDQREGLQAAISALDNYGAAAARPLGSYIAMEGLKQQRISDAIGNLGQYQGTRANNLSSLIGTLQQFEGGTFSRQSDIANAYLGLQTAPYQNAGAGGLASQYGQLAQQWAPYGTPAQPAGISPLTGALSGAITGAGVGAAAGPYGALAGAVIGGAGGYLTARS